jgi:iron complex outermembrane receptor protein
MRVVICIAVLTAAGCFSALAMAGSADPAAQTDQTAPGDSSSAKKTSSQKHSIESVSLEEVVVTAQKHDERLQDVPVPVTVLSAVTLADNDQVRLADFYTSVPGLTMSESFQGQPFIEIRGLSTGGGFFSNPTVGITVDGVPYGSSTPAGGGAFAPDLDPSDLARIEVLRGPQGTLYGASSLGGLLQYVTTDPSTDALSARVEAGGSDIYNGDGLGYVARAAVNVPLTGTLALRLSGFSREDPGYIDNTTNGAEGINKVNASGGRASLLWHPSDDVSLKLGAFVQNVRADAWSAVNPSNSGSLQTTSYISDPGASIRQYEVFTANLTAKLGRFDLTSVTGYSINNERDLLDATGTLASTLTEQFFNVYGAVFSERNTTKKLTQELRATTQLGDKVDWLLGLFYNHESSPYTQSYLAENLQSGAYVGSGICFCWKDIYEDYAVFSNFTFHLTERFDIQVGGRASRANETFSEVDSGLFTPALDGLPSPVNYGTRESSYTAYTYLLTPEYRFSSELMVYARLASGYRPGGPQALPISFDVPNSYKPDTTQNYELGIKGSAFDGQVSFDGSIYYIDWKDVQLTGVFNYLAYLTNGSGAKSQGLELAGQWKPVSALTIGGWIALNDAQLTRALLPGGGLYGVAGDPLPYSTRFSANLTIDDEFSLGRGMTGFVGAAESYIGERADVFSASSTIPRVQDPAYAKLDLHAGVKWGSWKFSTFANNVANKVGVLANEETLAFLIQPRTVGVSAAKTF